jgi:hypothetical protein
MFDQEQWKGTRNPTEQQTSNLRLNGWKLGRGSHAHNGPNFFDWFKAHVNILPHLHLDSNFS